MADGWILVGPGVFQRRYDPLDVSVGAIVGPDGITIVDTRNNPAEAEEVLADVARGFGLPVVAAIDTHAHYDHTFGNEVFAAWGLPVYGHHRIPAHFERYERPRLDAVQDDPAREPDKDWGAVTLTPPTVLVDRPTTVDLGGVAVELVPIAPGHTDTDLAVHVPSTRVWFVGDVIEESGPPMFGSGSYPLRWAVALDELVQLIGVDDVVVPGHGAAVDRGFVERQAAALRRVGDAIAVARRTDVDPEAVVFDAETRAQWPPDFLASAVAAGYADAGRDIP